MDYVPGSPEPGLYFRHEGEAQLIVGLHTNDLVEGQVDDPDAFFRGVDDAYVEDLIPRLLRRLPTLDDIEYQGGWAGLYPNSPDGQFIVGPYPDRAGVFVACGLNGVGIYLSPVVGSIVAEWVINGEPCSHPRATDLSPARFAG
jgi:glycine/D-amino acid oxidase-like deaminating enzyme